MWPFVIKLFGERLQTVLSHGGPHSIVRVISISVYAATGDRAARIIGLFIWLNGSKTHSRMWQEKYASRERNAGARRYHVTEHVTCRPDAKMAAHCSALFARETSHQLLPKVSAVYIPRRHTGHVPAPSQSAVVICQQWPPTRADHALR